jgi:hypothetical protein
VVGNADSFAVYDGETFRVILDHPGGWFYDVAWNPSGDYALTVAQYGRVIKYTAPEDESTAAGEFDLLSMPYNIILILVISIIVVIIVVVAISGKKKKAQKNAQASQAQPVTFMTTEPSEPKSNEAPGFQVMDTEETQETSKAPEFKIVDDTASKPQPKPFTPVPDEPEEPMFEQTRCPKCDTVFVVKGEVRPAKFSCPKCGLEGVLE